ncbi:MAG: oligopeptide/dipeptide ABC transporter ATP-binding protein [Candidatus Hodarchaeota archaeon]
MPPNLADPPSGCRFHPRCPIATAECKTEQPSFDEYKPNHFVACFHPGELKV